MWVGVLGPTVAARGSAGDEGIPLPAAKHRALLAALALHGGRPVGPDLLVATIWGPDAPPGASATLQSYVSVVRRALEPDLPARTPSSLLESSERGYLLRSEVDADSFARTVREVHAGLGRLATVAVPVADDGAAAARDLARLDDALGWWRGEPYADLPDSDTVQAERARLTELRVLALEDRATLLVATGRDAEAVAELEVLTVAHPLRERPWLLLAVALARTGRQADALAALERLRSALDEELGLEPTPAVRDLQTAILRHEVAAAEVGQRVDRPPQPDISVPDWPLVGRDAHLAVLEGLLAEAEGGRPRFCALIGEPGAGKTRLGAELALRARDQGALVLLGRCSQEEGAPPLWPWTTALGRSWVDGLAGERDRPDPSADHDAARFSLAERVRLRLEELSRDRTVVLALEDLHWADPSSLRVLRHLCAHLGSGRLLVLASWRRGERSPALAETVETLARRHATLLELEGLSTDETSQLLGALTGEVDPRLATAARHRTEGNPFFLIEYGRLARDEDRGLAEVLDAMPRTVADVIRRRITALPEPTAAALTAGAAIGREFGVDLLAPMLGVGELEALDLVEPALAVDLVQDLGSDRFRFGHALVRDTAYAALSPSRRERLHATIAGLVEAAGDASRLHEVARHWTAAGPRHAARAWRASAQAGREALAAHAADEATREYGNALESHRADPAATPRERFDLLVAYAEACRWSTRRLELHDALDEAVGIAAELGDPGLVHRAASISTQDALWPARAYGSSNPLVVDAIRAALDALPPDDGAVRCRLLLALASESYYAVSSSELDRLCAEAVAMARRLGDDALLVEALRGAAAFSFRRSTAPQRRAWCEEGIEVAGRLGDERARTDLRALRATVRCELGELEGVDEELEAIARDAHAQRHHFTEMVTLTFAYSWEAMRGGQEHLADLFERLSACFELVSTAHRIDIVNGASLFVPMWDADAPGPEPEMLQSHMAQWAVPAAPAATVLALRRGRPEVARRLHDEHGIDLETDNWFSPFLWALGAELALGLGEPEVAASAYRRLAPYRGTCVVSGTAPAFGPVDAYLALAAAATGETGLAAEHAEDALRLIKAWRVPLVERWFLDQRDRHAF